jgi:hypothetical protein
VQIQIRNGTAAQWTSANPTLAAGEVGIETDTRKQKFGDGTTAWNSLSYAGGTGTVTSVGATSPVASSGGATPTISLNAGYGDTLNPYVSKTANQVLAAPNGTSGVPSFRALVSADIPTLNQNTTGTAAGLSSTLAVTSGGTGQTTYTDGQLLIGNSTGNTLTKATLTAGTNVTITNSAGGITIAASGGGGGSPGGSTTQVQYNNAGAFGGISGFTTDGTRVTASTTIGVGGATPSTSGAGITFPATQSDSSNANTLDDYEEGTWTPTLLGSTTDPTVAVNGDGFYRKIGSQVFLQGGFVNVSTVGGVGGVLIGGLPFNVANISNGTVVGGVSLYNFTLSGKYSWIWADSSTRLALYEANSASLWTRVDISAGVTKFIYFSISYTTS